MSESSAEDQHRECRGSTHVDSTDSDLDGPPELDWTPHNSEDEGPPGLHPLSESEINDESQDERELSTPLGTSGDESDLIPFCLVPHSDASETFELRNSLPEATRVGKATVVPFAAGRRADRATRRFVEPALIGELLTSGGRGPRTDGSVGVKAAPALECGPVDRW